MVGQRHFAKWSRNSILFAERRTVNEIWPFNVFDVRAGRYFTRRLFYDASSVLCYGSHNSRTQIAVIHEKWLDKAISLNGHEIRPFSPNDAPLNRYNRLKFLITYQGVIALECYCTKLDPSSAIALTIQGLKLRLYKKNGRTRPFRKMITELGPFRQRTHR